MQHQAESTLAFQKQKLTALHRPLLAHLLAAGAAALRCCLLYLSWQGHSGVTQSRLAALIISSRLKGQLSKSAQGRARQAGARITTRTSSIATANVASPLRVCKRWSRRGNTLGTEGRVQPALTDCVTAQVQTLLGLNTINTMSLHSQTETPDFSNSYLHNYQVVFSPFLPMPLFFCFLQCFIHWCISQLKADNFTAGSLVNGDKNIT